MALRGDSVDNIPGAPGIGDKGSVELIKEFGTVEAVLDRAAEVKRKTYRESLEQNRETVLLSKELVTIDTPRPAAARSRRDGNPARPTSKPAAPCSPSSSSHRCSATWRPPPARPSVDLIDEPTDAQTAAFYAAARKHGFAFALDAAEPVADESEDERAREPLAARCRSKLPNSKTHFYVGVSADSTLALRLPLTPELRALLEDSTVPKRVHDWKLALHVLGDSASSCAAPLTTRNCSPTPSTPRTPRNHSPTWPPATTSRRPSSLPAAAAAIHALVPALREEVDKAGVARVYAEIDLPLAPVLYRMEQAGVRIDTTALSSLSEKFSGGIDPRRRAHLRAGRRALQHQLAQAARRRFSSQNLRLPAPPSARQKANPSPPQ